MQMMYQYVAKEITSMQLEDSHPQDYLNFYCLGKREPITESLAKASEDAQKVNVLKQSLFSVVIRIV